MAAPINETPELDAQGREDLVLDIALPVLCAWGQSVQVTGFRARTGVSGLLPREAARIRTLGIAASARATGIFEGANDFRFAFPEGARRTSSGTGVDADLAGHPIAPVISDIAITTFGLAAGTAAAHRVQGLTHVRGASARGYEGRALGRLGEALSLDLGVTTEVLGFEPQGLGCVRVDASRGNGDSRKIDWTTRGEFRALRVTLGGVRPKTEQLDKVEAAIREGLWEGRRMEPVVSRLITPGTDQGSFLQVDVECEAGGATFVEIMARSTTALTVARRTLRKALAFLDAYAVCDEVTGVGILTAAAAAGADFEIALTASERLSSAVALLREIGMEIAEGESRGLVVLRLAPPQSVS